MRLAALPNASKHMKTTSCDCVLQNFFEKLLVQQSLRIFGPLGSPTYSQCVVFPVDLVFQPAEASSSIGHLLSKELQK